MTSEVGIDVAALHVELRSQVREKIVGVAQAARTLMLETGSPETGIEFALSEGQNQSSQHFQRILAELYVNAGQHEQAAAIYRSLFDKGTQLHVSDLILAEIDATVALVDCRSKTVFIPIPKCASSTIKNFFTRAIYDQFYGEMVHSRHRELYQVIRPEQLRGEFRDYFKFTVVRDPIDRVVSYYLHNIFAAWSLKSEAKSAQEIMGLPTRPGPLQAVQNFEAYRNHFKDFRHHTDAISGYLDPFSSQLDQIYPMGGIGEIKARLERTFDRNIPDDRSMVSKNSPELKAKSNKAFSALKKWFEADYSRYFAA